MAMFVRGDRAERRTRCVKWQSRQARRRLHRPAGPHGTSASDAAVLIVAELSANAVFHGRVPGRDFALRLVHALVRVEVSDTHPALPVPLDPSADSDGGRGLILVEALADRWGMTDRNGPGKTIWAEVDLPPKTGAGHR
ncbi:ATP-binding protein [Streptomyces europaeiscabiei]